MVHKNINGGEENITPKCVHKDKLVILLLNTLR